MNEVADSSIEPRGEADDFGQSVSVIDREPNISEIAVIPALSDGRLPELNDSSRESRLSRRVYVLLAILIAAAFFVHALAYWTPAHPGTDQNGYLLGGKMIAKTLSMRVAPVRPGMESTFDPYQYVGPMWIGTGDGTASEAFYPKYPLGYPLLIAVALWCSPAGWGPFVAYLINPVSMMLAGGVFFFLARKFLHSLLALMAMIAFISSPVAQGLTSNPNSHATAVCCVVIGMWALVDWWQRRGAWRAILAGFLLGYACTIRYTEGALILPVAVVALLNLRPREWRSWRETLWLFGSWIVPIGVLLAFNLATMGTLTGYDPTNESVGFQFDFAYDNWETLLRQLNTFGLSYLFPLSLAGMIWMFWWNWRAASWLVAWVVPCLVTYLFYYWAPNPGPRNDRPGQQLDVVFISYTRFFLTVLPGLSLAAFWLIDRVIVLATHRWPVRRERWRNATTVATLGFAFFGAIVLIYFKGDDHPSLAQLRHGSLRDHLAPMIAWLSMAMVMAVGVACLVAASLFGRAVLAFLGAGALTALVLGMQMDVSLVAWDAAEVDQKNLQLAGDQIRASAPQGSVLFVWDTSILNYIQFTDDYITYQGQPFQQPFIQGLANTNDEHGQPQLLDPSRRLALYARLKTFDQKKLDDEEKSIIEASIDSSRRVFVLVPRRDGPNAVKRLTNNNRNRAAIAQKTLSAKAKLPDPLNRVLSDDRFDTEIVSTWTQIKPRFDDPGVSKPRNLHIGPPLDRSITWYQLLEITRKPPPPPAPPAPKPTKPPAPKVSATRSAPPKLEAQKVRPTTAPVTTTVPATVPSTRPTIVPTPAPASVPTSRSAIVPSSVPTSVPTSSPVISPTSAPKIVPSSRPATVPISAPANVATAAPATVPTSAPTTAPIPAPTTAPSSVHEGVRSPAPVTVPTSVHATGETSSPVAVPTSAPTAGPTFLPTSSPATPQSLTPLPVRGER